MVNERNTEVNNGAGAPTSRLGCCGLYSLRIMPNDMGTGQRKRSEARLLDCSEGLVINTIAKAR